MGKHVIVGAGGIGRATAAALLAANDEVIMVSRSGPVGVPQGVSSVALDSTDSAALIRVATGADSIVNAANPSKYWRWPQEWPVLAASLLTAAEATGAGLVTIGNLYGYGQVSGPMTEDTPLRPNGRKGEVRARMWTDALAAHRAGRVRATELRASDYLGPGAQAGNSVLNSYVIAPAARGKAVRMPFGDVDAPHSWTYLPDIGALAAALARGGKSAGGSPGGSSRGSAEPTGDEGGWGRAWHVPTLPPLSVREVARDVAAAAGASLGAGPVSVRAFPRLVVTAGGWFSPLLRELAETRHQFERPFVLDSSAAQERFALAPTPWETQLLQTVATLVSVP